LTTLPESIAKFTWITHLLFEQNKLIELPESIRNLTSLKELDLRENELTTLPVWLKKWIKDLRHEGCKVRIDENIEELLLTKEELDQLKEPTEVSTFTSGEIRKILEDAGIRVPLKEVVKFIKDMGFDKTTIIKIAKEAKVMIKADRRKVATKLDIKDAMKKLGIPRRLMRKKVQKS
ncbi:MAG: hypothetical protein ACFFD2_28050, partial [Promethearchaeota archaeon]